MENNSSIQAEVPSINPMLVKKKIKKIYADASLAICIQILVSLVIVVALQSITGIVVGLSGALSDLSVQDKVDKIQEITSTYSMTFTGIAYIIANLLGAIITVKKTKIGKIKDWFNGVNMSPLYVVLSCLALTGVGSAVITILSLCGSIFDNTNSNFESGVTSGLFSGSPIAVVGTILYMAILGPILEEVLCRGAILNISSVVSRRFALVASAILFGLMHGNFIQIINATIMGLFLAYVAEKTKSIVVPCIMHIFNNSLSVIEEFALKKWIPTENVDTVSTIVTVCLIVLGVVSIILVIKKYGKVSEDDGLKINTLVTKEEIAAVNPKKGEITSKLFFTTYSFIIVLVYALLMTLTFALGSF